MSFLATSSPSSTSPCILQALASAPHKPGCGSTGMLLTKYTASLTRPDRPSKSTIRP
uniref:Uncharacterized protein n=1 Tax=Arundo donax TaxID=35708 RepID=A0A0A9GKH0_ARUDO